MGNKLRKLKDEALNSRGNRSGGQEASGVGTASNSQDNKENVNIESASIAKTNAEQKGDAVTQVMPCNENPLLFAL